jgi:hypothetical protein
LESADENQFSMPLEVVKYLLSVANDYNYTERDLLRILLKMLLRKGPEDADIEGKQGWFSNLDKPALIASLVIVNTLIVILLIIFILRKKKKNDEVNRNK